MAMLDVGAIATYRGSHCAIWMSFCDGRHLLGAVACSTVLLLSDELGKVSQWLSNDASRYLTDYCTPVSDTVFRKRLRSASSHQVSVPRYRLSMYGRRAFSVAGPTVWNSLPEDMRDPECSVDSYRQSLKTFLFSQY